MAKPATIPTWDTNSTNVATPPAGYQTDGWTNGEPVDSSFFNWFMMWVAAWLTFLDPFFGDNGLVLPSEYWMQSPEIVGNYSTGVINASTTGIGAQVSANPADLSNAIHHLRKGDRITKVGAYVTGTTTGTITVKLSRYIPAVGGAAAFQDVATLTITNAPATQALYEESGGALPHTVPEGGSYILRLENATAGAVNAQVWSWGVKKDRL